MNRKMAGSARRPPWSFGAHRSATRPPRSTPGTPPNSDEHADDAPRPALARSGAGARSTAASQARIAVTVNSSAATPTQRVAHRADAEDRAHVARAARRPCPCRNWPKPSSNSGGWSPSSRARPRRRRSRPSGRRCRASARAAGRPARRRASAGMAATSTPTRQLKRRGRARRRGRCRGRRRRCPSPAGWRTPCPRCSGG